MGKLNIGDYFVVKNPARFNPRVSIGDIGMVTTFEEALSNAAKYFRDEYGDDIDVDNTMGWMTGPKDDEVYGIILIGKGPGSHLGQSLTSALKYDFLETGDVELL